MTDKSQSNTESIAAIKRLTRARTQLILKQPFYGTLTLYLTPIESPDRCDTAATDGKSLFYNPAYINSLSDAQLQGLLMHEVTHCAYRHMTRRGNRNPKRWNEACDYAINRDLQGVCTLPDGALLDSRYGPSMSAEDIYNTLKADPDDESNGKCPDPGMCGGVIDAAPSHDPCANADVDQDWQQKTLQAAAIAKASGCGDVPASIARLVEAARNVETSWQSRLWQFIDGRCKAETTWNRPNRRLLSAGVLLPGTQYKGISHLVCAIDTSGSIDSDLLAEFIAQIQEAMDSGYIERLTIIDCDTRVNSVETFVQHDDCTSFRPQGGGGTSFAPVFTWINANASDATATIYFTDMDCGNFGTQPDCPVLWAAYGERAHIESLKVPFGEVIHVK